MRRGGIHLRGRGAAVPFWVEKKTDYFYSHSEQEGERDNLLLRGGTLSTEVTNRETGVAPLAEIRDALARVLQSGVFLRSGQLQRLLRFLVEETLAGRGERLKEYVIGVEVFGRPPSYDPRIDSLVRVEARRLRATLASYYREDGRTDQVIIELEKGSYRPMFRRVADCAPANAISAQAQRSATAAAKPMADRAASGWRKR